MSNKYRDITNLAELEAAERKLRSKLSRKEEGEAGEPVVDEQEQA